MRAHEFIKENTDPFDTPQFKAWFKNSKLRNDDGTPMRLYHATTGDFHTFKAGGNNPKMSGLAIWLSPYAEHQAASHNIRTRDGFKSGTNVMPVYARMQRPLVIDDKDTLLWAREVFSPDNSEFPQIITAKNVAEITRDGEYDGIWFQGEKIGWGKNTDEIIVFSPNQVKSAIGNSGEYNPDDSSIIKESLLLELGDNTYKFKGPYNDNYGILYDFVADSAPYTVTFKAIKSFRGYRTKKNTVEVDFINTKSGWSLTGNSGADSLKILGTVVEIMRDFFNKYPNYDIMIFSSDNDEPSRIKLYDRFSKNISSYIPGWKFTDRKQKNTEVVYIYEKKTEDEPLNETAVDNPKFKSWFGNSKVVDSSGKPLVMLHGSGADISVFDPSMAGSNFGKRDKGIFFTNDNNAAEYYAGTNGGNPNITPVYLKISNPLTLEEYTDMFSTTPEIAVGSSGISVTDYYDDNRDSIQHYASKLNKDGILFHYDDDYLAVVFKPNQIKSAIGNSGSYDSGNPSIIKENSTSDNPKFKSWFGNSKVVDSSGKPLVVYHGTGKDFGNTFNAAGGRGKTFGTGAFFTSSHHLADTYTNGTNPNVIPVYLKLVKPVIVDVGGNNWNNIPQKAKVSLAGKSFNVRNMFKGEWDYPDDTASTDDIARWARKNGYDGVIFKNVIDHGPNAKFSSDEASEPSNIYVVFSSNQIKSAIGNNGEYNPDDESIVKEQSNNITDTPEFKSWYAGSNLYNDDGTPMRLYHGTSIKKNFDRFTPSTRGMTGSEVYLGDHPEVANGYASGTGARIIPVYARGKYIGMSAWSEYVHKYGWKDAKEAAIADGIAGIWDQKYECAVNVFDPKNIKSAIGNNGKFSSKTSNIMKESTLNELADSPYKFSLYPVGNNGDFNAEFMAARGIHVEAGFASLDDGTYEFGFMTSNSADDNDYGTSKLTGKSGKDALRIMSTIIAIIQKFTKTCKSKTIVFSADADEQSRVKIYDRFISKLSTYLPSWKLVSRDDNNGYVDYVITKNN